MRKFFGKLKIRKPDEMEKQITNKAQRNAYFFLIAALAAWSFYESCMVYINRTRLNILPCGLLVGAALVQCFSRLVMTRNAVKDDEENLDTSPLFKIILLVCVVVSIVLSAAAAFVFMGVRV